MEVKHSGLTIVMAGQGLDHKDIVPYFMHKLEDKIRLKGG